MNRCLFIEISKQGPLITLWATGDDENAVFCAVWSGEGL